MGYSRNKKMDGFRRRLWSRHRSAVAQSSAGIHKLFCSKQFKEHILYQCNTVVHKQKTMYTMIQGRQRFYGHVVCADQIHSRLNETLCYRQPRPWRPDMPGCPLGSACNSLCEK